MHFVKVSIAIEYLKIMICVETRESIEERLIFSNRVFQRNAEIISCNLSRSEKNCRIKMSK